MSILNKLEDRKFERETAAAAERVRAERIRKEEARKLRGTVSVVKKHLEGFKVKKIEGYGEAFKVDIPYSPRGWSSNRGYPSRHVYVVISWETRDVKYCDEMAPEPTRCLEIRVGYEINSTSFICSLESFETEFIRFIEQNYCVT